MGRNCDYAAARGRQRKGYGMISQSVPFDLNHGESPGYLGTLHYLSNQPISQLCTTHRLCIPSTCVHIAAQTRTERSKYLYNREERKERINLQTR